MRVLGISGSPRKNGNTDYAIRLVLRRLRELVPGLETEFLRVADYQIEHCRGCRYCMTAVECTIKDDDVDMIVDRMHRADLIILGSPVYWYGPPGVIKDFIDRTHGFYPDEGRFRGRRVALISVAAQSGYPSHERIMSWLRHYGAEYVAKVRLRAREIGELEGRPKEREKLEGFSRTLAEMMKE